MRIGAKKRPFYRVVVIDERAKRTGDCVELVGTYNPLTDPKDIKLKKDRIDYWIKQGAQMSTGYLRIIGKAPQRLPRKAKKAKKEKSTPATEDVPAKQAETPKQEEQPTDTSEVKKTEESEAKNEGSA